MVRVILILFIWSNFIYAGSLSVARSFVDPATYSQKVNLINALFANKSKYTKRSTGEIDTLKILQELKSNGLLKLSYGSVADTVLRFDTKGNPLVALRIINDTLEDMGYNNYLIKSISKHEDLMSVSFTITSSSLVDPVNFSYRLQKLGCVVDRVQRSGEYYWGYKIDASGAKIYTIELPKNKRVVLNKPSRAYWFMVYGASNVEIFAHAADNWFSKITFYDKFLHPIDEVNEDRKKRSLNVKIPQNAFYMKVDDRYRLENIKRGLTLILR